MKVLWVVHDVLDPFFPFVEGKPSKGGSWITPLFNNLVASKKIQLAIVTPVLEGKPQKKEIDGVLYYSLGIEKGANNKAMTKELAEKYLVPINDFKPEIIHVHGTEVNFGQLRKYLTVKIPIVCSIQGFINAYLPYLKSSIYSIDLSKFKSIKNRLGKGGETARLKQWIKYSAVEKEILTDNNYFIGRTIWDKAHLLSINPQATYYKGEELLRPAFINNWTIKNCVRHQIFISSTAYPIKGFHILLQAVGLLKEKYPNIQIAAPLSSFNMNTPYWKDVLLTEDYARYLKSEIKRLGLANNIKIYKRLSAEEMAECYSKAHVFVLPSFVENSPNSLGEAMIVGTPAIVSPVGGVQSIVKDEESALFFPAGDSAVLALQIDRLFSDDALAEKLSHAASLIAKIRHNNVETTIQYIDNYNQVIKKHNESSAHFS